LLSSLIEKNCSKLATANCPILVSDLSIFYYDKIVLHSIYYTFVVSFLTYLFVVNRQI
jgi:hypothetical protein